MATVNHRRRPVTYGKTSRKPTANLSPAAVDAFSQTAFADEVRGITSLTFPDRKKYSSRATSAIQRTNAFEGPGRPLQHLSSSSLVSNLGAGSSLERKNALYDLPSSDEESRSQFVAPGAAGRKRRKVVSKVESKESVAVVDNELPRPRNVFEASESQISESPPDQLLPTVSTPKSTASKRTLAKSLVRNTAELVRPNFNGCTSHRTERPAYRENLGKPDAIAGPEDSISPSLRPTKEPADVKVADKVRQRRLPCEANKLPMKMSFSSEQKHKDVETALPSSSSGLQVGLTRDSETNSTPTLPQTPSKRSRLASQATSPHQRDLWEMLLPTSHVNDCPNDRNVSPLKTMYQESHNKAWHGEQRMSDMHKTSSKSSGANQRRRLVDTLQRQDTTSSNEDVSVDYATTSDEIDSENETNINVVPNYESQNTSHYDKEPMVGVSSQDQRIRSTRQPLQLRSGLGAKTTYARQRSYLTENELNKATTFDLPIVQDSSTERKLRNGASQNHARRLQFGESQHEKNEEPEEEHGPALRSIYELRRAGGNSRLVSEMEAMIDDISDQSSTSLTLKRHRLLELTIRLQESSFNQTFVDQGFASRLLDRTETCTNAVESILISAAILQLLAGTVSTGFLSEISSPPVVQFLIGLLDSCQDITSVSRMRTLKMSKVAHSELIDFRNKFLSSHVWSTEKPKAITARLLSLQILERSIRQTMETGSVEDVLPHHAIHRITRTLVDPRSIVTSSFSDEPTAEFQLAVSILESCTITRKNEIDNELWSGTTLEIILDLLPSLDTRFNEVPENLRSLTLRLYLNLTNNNPELCKAFARSDVLQAVFNTVISHFGDVSEDTATHSLVLDSLILSLGSLINLAEWCDTVRESTLNMRLHGSTYLDLFLQIFMSNSKKTAEVCAGAPLGMISVH